MRPRAFGIERWKLALESVPRSPPSRTAMTGPPLLRKTRATRGARALNEATNTVLPLTARPAMTGHPRE
eukprot:7144274-Pyramimonas_sp.AAC.1